MAAVTIRQMRAIEAKAFAAGWREEQLLDLAGQRLGIAIGRFFPKPGTAIAYLGKGHNAGDALVALRILQERFGWKIAVRLAWPFEICAPLTRKKWREICRNVLSFQMDSWRDLEPPLVLLDGLVGIGSSGALRGPLFELAREMETLRRIAGARIAAVDLPSGVDADTGEIFPGAVTADVTFMIGSPKRGLLFSHAVNAVGALALVPLEILSASETGALEMISPVKLQPAAHRPFDFHKGMAGRVSILAGSADYTGAAVLAATGALRGGAGLITLHVPPSIAALISSKCPPEIIVRPIFNPRDLLGKNFDALVIGCGLGELDNAWASGLLELIARTHSPTVIDADALNFLARFGRCYILDHRHVLTPHPGEFQRLAPDLSSYSREEAAWIFSRRNPATLLLKGSRTLIAQGNFPLLCNPTGTPGMATGGQGDLLAGVIGALLAAGETPREAAARAAWLCGRASELALVAEETLTPSDTASQLGRAFLDWKYQIR